MSLFGGSNNEAAEAREREITERIDRLQASLDKKTAETAVLEEIEDLKQAASDLRISLKESRADHERELKKLTEEHEKNVREIEHKVGLTQKANEQDQKAAVKEAELKVREANLETERTQLKTQIDFQREEMEKRSESIENLLGQVMERLPKHSVNEHVFRGDVDTDTKRQLAAGDQ